MVDTYKSGPQVSVELTRGTQMCVSCYAPSWEENGRPATPIYMVSVGRMCIPMCENCIRELFKSATKLGLNMTDSIEV